MCGTVEMQAYTCMLSVQSCGTSGVPRIHRMAFVHLEDSIWVPCALVTRSVEFVVFGFIWFNHQKMPDSYFFINAFSNITFPQNNFEYDRGDQMCVG